MGLFVNVLAAGLLAFTDLLLCRGLYAVAEAPHAAEHRDRRAGRRAAAGHRLGRGDGHRCRWRRCVLVAIIFMWTPPHFWALSLWRSEDYARAGVPMLPVVKGKRATRLQIFALHAAAGAAGRRCRPCIGLGGTLYLVAVRRHRRLVLLEAIATFRETRRGRASRPPHRLFGVSLLYIFVLFAALIAERLLGICRRFGREAMDDESMTRTAMRSANGASATSRWRSRWAALVILFYLMSIVQWHEHTEPLEGLVS